ncbi:MAG: MBL fold metallo-hydrolase [Chloroflexi bacterium]|nr:MBL fold metallo-hydrolase [Chloroflexota bacterium]
MKDTLRLTILGSGLPVPTPDRFGSSYVLHVGDELLMFDCGPATTHKLAKVGLAPAQVGHLFFTHHHFDHDVDYPCFLLTRWLMAAGQETELQVYGPSPTELLTARLLDERTGAFAHELRARSSHPLSLRFYSRRGGPLPRRPPAVAARDIGPGWTIQRNGWEVISAAAEHAQPWLDSLAYRVNADAGSVVITGDTRSCRSVAELARGADVLVCVCVDLQSSLDASLESEWLCGTTAAGKLAEEAGVKKLVLVHNTLMSRPGRREQALAEVAGAYGGEIIWGEELLEIPGSS